MTTVVTKEQLMTNRVPEPEEVPIPGLDGVVRIRGLSRAQVLKIKTEEREADEKREEGEEGEPVSFESRLVSAGLVEPAMTPEEVEVWRHSSLSPEIEEVTKAISTKSALNKGADKEAYKSTS